MCTTRGQDRRRRQRRVMIPLLNRYFIFQRFSAFIIMFRSVIAKKQTNKQTNKQNVRL